MTRLLARARQLDRRVLKDDRPLTTQQWDRRLSRWPRMLATAVVALAGGGVAAVAGDALLPPLMGLDALLFAFLAGRMKSEHDRLEGRPGLWHKHPRRPRGR